MVKRIIRILKVRKISIGEVPERHPHKGKILTEKQKSVLIEFTVDLNDAHIIASIKRETSRKVFAGKRQILF